MIKYKYIYSVAEFTFIFTVLHKNTFFKICLRLSSDILNVFHIDPTLNMLQDFVPKGFI